MIDNLRVTRVYGAGATKYDAVMANAWQDLIDRDKVVRYVEPNPQCLYLEIGVGTGLNIQHYPRGTRLVAIDLTAPMIAQAARKVKAKTHFLILMDGAKLGFPSTTFDGVISTLTISACPDPNTLLKEALRVCRPGGRLAVLDVTRSPDPKIANIQEELIFPYATTTGFPPPSQELPGGVIVYDPTRDIPALIREAGWSDVDVELLDPGNPFTCRAYIFARKHT